MGDAVNLAARLMAKAGPGQIYATADVLDRSNTLFETTELEPFAVKGKAKPIQAWSVGRAQGSRKRHVSAGAAAVDRPRRGARADSRGARKRRAPATGGWSRSSGKPASARRACSRRCATRRQGFRKLHASCEAYTASTPYAVWRELLRELMDFGRDDPEDVIVERLRSEVATRAPDLTPWLPLIAIAFDIDVAPTPEVELLAEENRRAILHRSVRGFLEVMMPEPALIEIENAHHMDEASAEFLSYLTERIDSPAVAVRRRPPPDRRRIHGTRCAPRCRGSISSRLPRRTRCAWCSWRPSNIRCPCTSSRSWRSGRAEIRSSCATC